VFERDSRIYVEAELLRCVREAERVYRMSATAAKEQVKTSRELGWDHIGGGCSFHSAINAERLVLERYRDALAALNDFLRSGKTPSRKLLLEPLLKRAIAFTGAAMGNIQVFDREEAALKIEVQLGFHQRFLHFFGRVRDGRSACGAALQAAQRVVVTDVQQSPIFAGTEALDVLVAAGVQAVQSTPIVGPSGELTGMLSTHYQKAVSPSEPDLRAIDELARDAGVLIAAAEL